MARINTYPTDSNVEGSDKLLGSNTDGSTKNFTVSALGAFINSNFPVPTLQQVLDEDNEAAQNIILDGDVSASNINVSANGDIGGDLTVGGSIDVDGPAAVGALSASSVTSSGNGSFGGALSGSSLDVDGSVQGGSGSFSTTLAANSLTLEGDLSANDATLSGNLSAASGEFSGQLEVTDDLTVNGSVTSNGLQVNGGTFESNVNATMQNISAVDVTATGAVSGGSVSSSTDVTATNDLYVGAGISLGSDFGSAGQVIKSSGGGEPSATWEDINFEFDLLIDSSQSANQVSGTYTPTTILFGGPQSSTDVSLASNGLITFATAGQYLIMTDFIFGNPAGNARMAVAMYKNPDIVDNQIIRFVGSGDYQNVQMVFPFTAAASNVIQFKLSKDTALDDTGGLYGIPVNTFTVGSDLTPFPSARIRIYKMAVS
jgi:cytoskeletal protein CcmA (bactofilin family)